MTDIGWLSQEAHKIHDWFHAIFYLLVLLFLLLGVVIEYFKMPLGLIPSFGPLVGRVLVAAILLHSYPEVANTIVDISDGLSEKLGDLTQFKLALDKISDKVDQLSWSWTSVRQSVIVGISYLCFFLLYFSIHVAQALYLYTLVMLYIFSPILIALFVLPATAGATSALYRSLIEASLWKPVWCVIGTLLWSTGISDIQGPASSVSFLTAICFSLMAAGSLVLTPLVVHALAGAGLSSMARSISNVGVDGLGTITPMRAYSTASMMSRRTYNAIHTGSAFLTRPAPRLNRVVSAMPRFKLPPRRPLFEAKDLKKKQETS